MPRRAKRKVEGPCDICRLARDMNVVARGDAEIIAHFLDIFDYLDLGSAMGGSLISCRKHANLNLQTLTN